MEKIAKKYPIIGYSRVSLLCFLVLALSGCASVDTWLRDRVYKPQVLTTQVWQQEVGALGFVSQTLSSGNGQVQLLVTQAQPKPEQPAVLFLHGTYRHVLGNVRKMRPMRDAGFVVYAPDYRGWGASSPGLPDEEGIHADAWTAWQQVRGRHQRWVIYGHSMGGAVAAHLTARMGGASPEVCALVLESTFPSFERVAAQSVGGLGVVLTRMSRQRMNTAAALRSVAVPVRVWHGSADRTVDVSMGRELFDAIGAPKVWETWPLDHSNLQDDPSGRYAQRWRELAQECPLRP